jgi:MtfA peptidase
MSNPFRRWRRKRIRRRPFPDAWRRILEEGLPYYRCLPPESREELHQHIKIFLAEKYFEGAGGLIITDQIRVIIAAQACILLLHRETDYYPMMRTIIVYPSTYLARGRSIGPGGIVREEQGWRQGESWKGALSSAGGGPVILSWQDVQRGAADPGDGHNVVFHEFAHQLDAESGTVEGAPVLEGGAGGRSQYIAWARILGSEYQSLLRSLAAQQPTVLRPYAGTSPAEFFAVLTEVFFERPAELKAQHPDLYEQMRTFFRQDPALLRCGHDSSR